MEAAVTTLQTLFQAAEANLHYVSRKLDTEFDGKYATVATEHVPCRRGGDPQMLAGGLNRIVWPLVLQLNPRRLLQRIQAAQSQLERLAAEISETDAEKKARTRRGSDYCLPPPRTFHHVTICAVGAGVRAASLCGA